MSGDEGASTRADAGADMDADMDADADADAYADVDVLRLRDVGLEAVAAVFRPAGLSAFAVPDGAPIPGSHWGDDEAGLIGDALHVRPDTPVHSALHEGCHWLLMSEERRVRLHTDAGGTAVEESAVCCLQILLADRVAGMGRARMLADMDRWGYSFRLGSTAAWFVDDADDARAFLHRALPRLGAMLEESGPASGLDPEDRRTD